MARVMNVGRLTRNQSIPENRRRLGPGGKNRKREKIYQYMLDQPVLYRIEVCMHVDTQKAAYF